METSSNQKLKILMVEDDLDLCEGWSEIFRMLGHEIQCCQRGLQALDQKTWLAECDLLISDYYLPDINGVELLTRVRELRPDLPGILLTGSREAGIVASARQLPKVTILHKPVNISDLEKTIHALV